MNIAKKWLPGKRAVELLVVPAIVLLVGLTAFGLGRISVVGEHQVALVIHAPVVNGVEQPLTPAPSPLKPSSAAAIPAEHNFVTSKNGTKYYPAGCSGASRIKPENYVWFTTAGDAQDAGYTLAAGCK